MFRAAEPPLAREADGRASRLIEAGLAVQRDLFGGIAGDDDRIDDALDAVRDRFGEITIVRGRGFGTSLVRQGPSNVE